MCPITRKQLRNSSKTYLVKPTGAIVSKEGVALVLADKSMDGKKVSKSDIIPMSGGGTGFSANGGKMASSGENKYVLNMLSPFDVNDLLFFFLANRYPKPKGIFWKVGGAR